MTVKKFFEKSACSTRLMTTRRVMALQKAIDKVFPNCSIMSQPLFYVTHPDDEVLTLEIPILNKMPNAKKVFKIMARFEIDFDAEYSKAMKDVEVALIEYIKENSDYNDYMDNLYGID